ncbi:MAG: BrnA antitoxin family protein [Thiothrix sp.]|uniref:BrnA antitoxin family protein n=1 Tax=Thiothrix sp. TaxID=1032 RepID=UPI002627B0D2|nr:BrnA antitoxin family protein [Thiothrix sp.]MDD5395078.1 BrnA antitoxin family protein [Thiothrix sp.]
MKEQYDKTTKEKITIRLDPDVVDWFRKQVEGGGNYQSLINEALKAHIKQQGEPLETILRRVIREEIKAEQQQVAA